MTLLIGTLSKSHITLTADGMSFWTSPNGTRSVGNKVLQKIFPVPDAAIAVVHHGENLLEEKPIASLLTPILNKEVQTIEAARDVIIGSLDRRIRSTLISVQPAERCVFWLCGFLGNGVVPKIFELEWVKSPGTVHIIEKELGGAGDLCMGGNGHDPVREFTRKPIDKKFCRTKLLCRDENYHLGFHQKLWDTADKRQRAEGQQRFGGRRHVLVLKPTVWNWEVSPLPIQQPIQNATS